MLSLDEDQRRQVVAQYLTQAIGEEPSVPWQLAARLSKTGVFSVVEQVTEEIVALKDALAVAGVEQAGSDLFVSLRQEGEARSIYEVTGLLAIPNCSFASVLAQRLESSIIKYATSPDLPDIVQRYHKSAQSQLLEDVLRSAAELDDTLLDDWGWQVGTLAQAVQAGFHDIVTRQIGRLLRFDLLGDQMIRSLQERFVLSSRTLTETGNQERLSLDLARQRLGVMKVFIGHLPWRADVGVPLLMRELDVIDQASIWMELDAWSPESCPATWFHSWFVAMSHPEGVPDAVWPVLWRRISAMASMPDEAAADQSVEAKYWSLYTLLMRLYVYRIETGMPSVRADFAIWCGSFLASEIVSAIDPSTIDLVKEVVVRAFSDARRVWQISPPSALETPLRACFHEFGNHWPAAIQASVSDWAGENSQDLVPLEARNALLEMFRGAAIRLFVISDDESPPTEKLLLNRLTQLRVEWAEILGGDSKQWLSVHEEMNAHLSSAEVVTERFLGLSEGEGADSVAALMRWGYLLRTRRIPLDGVVDVLHSENWIRNIEPKLDHGQLDRVLYALLGVVWIGRPTLRVEIPHWAASRCIAYAESEERRRLYFSATVLLSLKAGATSPVLRMRQDDVRNRLVDDCRNLSELLKRMLLPAPAWIAGRIRSVLAVLQD